MFIEIMSFVVTIFGILMSIGHFPQAYKIYKNRNSKDISLITYSIFFLGSIAWVIYGILLNDIPIVLSFIIGVIGSYLVLFLTIRYRYR